MTEYYNFKVSEFEISYDPYWYEKSNILLYFLLAIIILALGITMPAAVFKPGVFIALPLSCILFVKSTYRVLVKNKTRLIFDKQNDALYAVNPLGKRKLLALSTIIELISISENTNYCYVLTKIKNGRIKNIPITT